MSHRKKSYMFVEEIIAIHFQTNLLPFLRVVLTNPAQADSEHSPELIIVDGPYAKAYGGRNTRI